MQLHDFFLPMVCGIVVGLCTRLLLTQSSYRQFPSKPNGMIIHVFLGFVASLLGALIVPAIFKPDFTAGVFISIGTAQFHTIRSLERDSWKALDKGELVPRGDAYIEGLAVTYEARIFCVIGVSAFTTFLAYSFHWPTGLVCGFILALGIRFLKRSKIVANFATVKAGVIRIQNNDLYVDDLKIVSIPEDFTGSDSDFISVVIEPNDFSAILTFNHFGQQQTLLYNLSIAVGTQSQSNIKPVASYFPKSKKLVLVMSPLLNDQDKAIEAVLGAPVLEALVRRSI